METKKSYIVDHTVHTSTNYDMFKHFPGNRAISKPLVARLKKSLSEKQIPTPLVVDEYYRVIDGQHRFEALKSLGLPVYYIIVTNISLNDVHVLNTIGSKWTINEYLAAYSNLGLEEYIYLAKVAKNTGIGLQVLLSIENFSAKESNTGSFQGHKYKDKFNNGEFKITNKPKFEYVLNCLNEIRQLSNLYKRHGFVLAYLKCLSLKTTAFSHDEFIQKLKENPKSLVPCTQWQDYLMVIEEIYNYKRRIKVSFKYAS